MSGPLLLIAAALSYCLMGVAVRLLVSVHGEPIAWLGLLRFLLGALAMLLPALFGAWSLRVHNRPVFVLRGLIGAAGMTLLYVAIAEVGLGRGTVLIYLLGVVAAVSGIFILGERLNPRLSVAVGLGAIGVILVADGHLPHGAEWLALLGALCCGITLALIRLLRRTDSNQVVFLSQGLFGTLLLLPFVFAAPMPSTPSSWLLITAMIAADVAGQLTMNAGLARTPVAQGGALLTLTPLLSLAVGYSYFAEPLSALQWLGCGTVLAATVIALLRRNSPPAVMSSVPLPGAAR